MIQWEYGLLILGMMFIVAAMFSLGRSRKKRSATQTTARDHVDRARQKQGVRDELEALMVDINRMARDLGAQLDAKIVRIEKALRDADQRITQLEALQDALAHPHTHTQASTPSHTEDHHAGLSTSSHHHAHQADPLTREVYALADQGIGPHDIAEQLGEHIGKVELILALRHG